MKKKTASEAEIKKLYDPNTFYEHGDNVAMKKFMEIATENCQQGRLIDHRTYFKDKLQKFLFTGLSSSNSLLGSGTQETGMISFNKILNLSPSHVLYSVSHI